MMCATLSQNNHWSAEHLFTWPPCSLMWGTSCPVKSWHLCLCPHIVTQSKQSITKVHINKWCMSHILLVHTTVLEITSENSLYNEKQNKPSLSLALLNPSLEEFLDWLKNIYILKSIKKNIQIKQHSGVQHSNLEIKCVAKEVYKQIST